MLMVVALLFVGYAAWDLSRRWESGSVEVDWVLVFVSVVPLAIGSFLQGFGWIALIRGTTKADVPTGPALSLYLDSQLARYTPGKVGLPVVRMAGAKRIGVAAGAVGSSLALEMLSWVAVGGIFGFALLSATSQHSAGVTQVMGRWGLPMLAACALGLIVLLAVDRRRFPGFVRRLLKAEGTGALVPPVLPLVQSLYWLSWAAHGYFVSCSVGLDGTGSIATSGLYVLAPVAGFLALAVPAGVGVREAVLAVGLAPTLGSAPALAAALLSRGVSLVADLVAWAVARLVRNDKAPPK